jgi:hypothetical protein
MSINKNYIIYGKIFGTSTVERENYYQLLIDDINQNGLDLSALIETGSTQTTPVPEAQEGPQTIFTNRPDIVGETINPDIVQQAASSVTNRPRIIGEDTTVATGVVGGRVVAITPRMIEREIVNSFNSRNNTNVVEEEQPQNNFEDVPGGTA